MAEIEAEDDDPDANPREALIRKLLAQEHARWAVEDTKDAVIVKANKRFEIETRAELITKLVEQQNILWAEEDAKNAIISKAEQRFEHEAREALIRKLLAQQNARWNYEDAKIAAAVKTSPLKGHPALDGVYDSAINRGAFQGPRLDDQQLRRVKEESTVGPD